jgi:hypothetical protein
VEVLSALPRPLSESGRYTLGSQTIFTATLLVAFSALIAWAWDQMTRRQVSPLPEISSSDVFEYMLSREISLVKYWSGELSPRKWKKIENYSKKYPNIQAQVVAGPHLLIDRVPKEALDGGRYIAATLDEFWEMNPVFRAIKNDPREGAPQVTLTMKKTNVERHFGVTIKGGYPSMVFVEYFHEDGEPGAGVLSEDQGKATEWDNKFQELINGLGGDSIVLSRDTVRNDPSVLEFIRNNISFRVQ